MKFKKGDRVRVKLTKEKGTISGWMKRPEIFYHVSMDHEPWATYYYKSESLKKI